MTEKQKTRPQLGLEDWTEAARLAVECNDFVPDLEEEQIADEPRSCYNCRYRRWQTDSIACLSTPPLMIDRQANGEIDGMTPAVSGSPLGSGTTTRL